MDIIQVNNENIAKEHICCSIADKKGETGVADKKAWLSRCFDDGLVFKKLDARGKVFIEYIPTEKAWVPVEGENSMHINCFWVSGQFKGQGYGNKLMEECMEDSRKAGKNGITVISGKKKLPYLSDPKFLKYKGFQTVDTAGDNYELLFYPLKENAPLPKFKETAKKGTIEDTGIVLYYTNQCPFASKYAKIFKNMAEEKGVAMTLHQITSSEEAKSLPTLFSSYSLFHQGKFITNEILSEKKITAFLDEL